MSESLATTISSLALVLGLLLGLRLLLVRMGIAQDRRTKRIRVLETCALATRSRLHLVEIDGATILVGATDGGMALLRDSTTTTGDPVSEELPAAEAQAASKAPSRSLLATLSVIALVALAATPGYAEGGDLIVQLPGGDGPGDGASILEMLSLLTVLAIAPSILLMATCFTRIVIVLAFVRQAIGVQHLPPNQVLIGLALFLTLFVMAPVGEQIAEVAYRPYVAGALSGSEAVEAATAPVRVYLAAHTREEDLALFTELAGEETVAEISDVPLTTLLPSFLVSELRRAFEIGFVVFLPFLIIDLVISSMLISMGMIVLPPIVVSLPFKIMLFVLVDGWNLILGSLVRGLV